MTAIVADEIYARHLTGWGHPESPERYYAIVKALEAAGLKKPENSLSPRRASKEEILLCHSEEYYHLVEEECKRTKQMGVTDGSMMISTGDAPICPDSFEVALLAVGGVLVAVDAVMSNKAHNVFAVVRPPGHHACRERGMGFCLFNNVAIGARYAQNKYGLDRVLIADWDVHHGNGTQEIFYEDPSVFYFSCHQYPFYPGTGASTERGRGTILNVPIQPGESSRHYVLEAFEKELPQAMENFRPDFVFISIGFDSHIDDFLGSFNLTTEDFAHLTQNVRRIAENYCQGRLISVLEGGYNLKVLEECSIAHVEALAN